MKRTVAGAALAVLVAVSCSGGSGPAATVNGREIARADVEGLLFEIGDDFSESDFVDLLELYVQWNVVADAAADDLGITFTDAEIGEEVDSIYADQGADLTFEEFLQQRNISASGFDQLAEQALIVDAVSDAVSDSVTELSDQEAEQLLSDDPMSWTEVCGAHILVATAVEADAVLARLEAGEDFAALAQELSIDPGTAESGGSLGCAVPASYAPEFAEATMTAEIGEVTGPVETQYGFHIIRVDSRTPATVEEVKAATRQADLANAVDDWYVAALGSADVTIADEYGTWDPETAGIVPAAG